MTSLRFSLQDFSLANPIYSTAEVSIFTVDPATQEATTTLAPLYADPVGVETLQNPQRLDNDGKWQVPVYVDQPVVMSVLTSGLETHTTGIVAAQSQFRGDWASDTVYLYGDQVRDGAAGLNTGNLYTATATHTSSDWEAELAIGRWLLTVESLVGELYLLKSGGTVTGNLTVQGTTTLAAFTASGTGAVAGDFAVATNKFTVAAATGNTAVAGTLNVTGATTLKQTNIAVGTYQLTGALSAATAPWYRSVALTSPSDLSTAPTASPRDLTMLLIQADTSVVYTDATRERYGNLVTVRYIHQMGATGGAVASSWAGSRVLSKHTQITRNHPREYADPAGTPATLPSWINSWREQTYSFSFGGTTPFTVGSKGRGQVYYGKVFLNGGTGLTGGSNMAANIQYEAEWYASGRASTRSGAGIRMNVLDIQGVAPPEGFIAYGGTRGKATAPGWMTIFGAGIYARVAADPYHGDFIRAGCSAAERTPLMRRGVDIADVTFGKDAMRWLGGDISGGARDDDDAGRLRIGPMYLRGDSAGGVIDAAGYVGQPFGYIFTGVELSGALNVVFNTSAPLLEDDRGGLYRGVLTSDGRNLDRVITLIPPMYDGTGGAPATTLTIRVRDEFGASLRFPVLSTATTTSIPTNLSVTTDNYFSDNGPWELTFLTGPAAGETRAVTAYDAATGTLTTAAFSTDPTATLNLITNGGFGPPFPVVEDTISNGWQYTLNGGTGSVSVALGSGVCVLVGDGTNAAALDQEITVVDTTVYYVVVAHLETFTLKVGSTRGGTDMLDTVVAYTDPDGATQVSEIPFTASGTAAHLRFENVLTSPVSLDYVQCGASSDPLTSGIQAVLRYPAATIEQTWTARPALSIQPSGGSSEFGGTLNVVGNLSVATNKLTVNATTGATVAASTVTGTALIPSDSTVPTNGMYLPAANTLGWAANTTAKLRLDTTALFAETDDGLALGKSGTAFSDLFLASGSVINFNAGDATITHSSNLLTFAGARYLYGNATTDDGTTTTQIGGSLRVTGTSTLATVSATGVGTFNLSGTAIGSVSGGVMYIHAADGSSTGQMIEAKAAAPRNSFRRANGTSASPTALVTNDELGIVEWRGFGTSMTTARAYIRVRAANDWDASLQGTFMEFHTTAATGTTMTNKVTIGDTGNLIMATGHLCRYVVNTGTAAGTTIADALQLTREFTRINSAAAGTGVILPTGVVGMHVVIYNAGANPIKVYANGSETIDGTAGSTGVTLTNGNRCLYVFSVANTWHSMMFNGASA